MHLDQLTNWKKKRTTLPRRIWTAVRQAVSSKDLYGLQWGDPDFVPPLKFVLERYVLPYVNPEHTAIEIGPGGGRWTRYLLQFKKLYVLDCHQELLDELRKNFDKPNMIFVKNNGTDFPNVERNVDFVFSFGAFVHMGLPLIEEYLRNLKSVVKPGANIVIQYSDRTKIMGQNIGFSDNTPAQMRQLVLNSGYRILEEDLTTMWHSSIVRFAPS